MAEAYETKVRPEKVKAVDEIREKLERSGAVMLTEYRGLTVGELAALRTELTRNEVEYRVVKNTLTFRAAEALGMDVPREMLEGPTAVAYCFGDPVQAAKALATFARDHPALVVKGGFMEGRTLSADEAKELASVDSRDVSLAKICGSMTSPLAGIVGVLEAPLSRIVYVLEQLAARGEAA